jgi:hypothetical protein
LAAESPTLVRLGPVVFVLGWTFGPYALRSAVPIWLPFLIALGLEVHFFVRDCCESAHEKRRRAETQQRSFSSRLSRSCRLGHLWATPVSRFESGRPDLNRGPLVPQGGALW